MKTSIASLLLVLSLGLFAQEPPKFLDGFKYSVLNFVDEDGVSFVGYKIRDKEDWSRFNKKFRKMKKLHTEVENNIVFTTRKFGDYEVLRTWAWGYKSFVIYEE